jgi:mediator of replication checkpoint protein 1
LVDDDAEFVHLQADTQMSSEDEDEEPRKVISIEALNDEIREAVRNKEVSLTAYTTDNTDLL